jgi:WS/DGAT/MGAT family acyltransferase
MAPTRLSAQDAAFIYGEDQRIPLHVGCLGFMEAGPLRDDSGAVDITRIREAISQRLHLFQLFRKKIAHIPFDQGRPVWVDDPNFAIEKHVHLTAVPRPGSRRQVLDLMGRLQSGTLDRGKPLWEIYFVDGLGDGDTLAVISRVHHSMIDGTSGVEIAMLLFDLSAEERGIEAPAWEPAAEESPSGLLFDALFDRAGDALRRMGKVVDAVADIRKPIDHAVKFVRAVKTLSGEIDSLPFNAPVGSRRAFAVASLPLDVVLETKRALGATVNEVGLAAVTGALRRYCGENGIDADELGRITAICPVDNRRPGDTHAGCNVSSMVVELPVDEPDLRRRVDRIVETSRERKDQDVAEGSNMWARFTSLLPATMLRMSSWLQFRGLMGQSNLLVSNVRGPSQPFYCFGAKVHSFHPYFGVQDGLGLNVVLFSYGGELMIGIAADPHLVPALDSFAEGIVKSFGELATAV